MIVINVRMFIIIAAACILAGCQTIQQPTSIPPLPQSAPTPPVPSIPPLPPGVASTAKQAKQAKSRVLSLSVAAVDTSSTNYGAVTKVPVMFEGGNNGIAIKLEWNNWPPTGAYTIQKSTNLVNWQDAVQASPDPGRTLLIYDLDQAAYYRIVSAPR